LFIDINKQITYCDGHSYFNDENNKEITIAQLFNDKVPRPTHIVAWEVRGCGDPIQVCYAEQEARDKVKELFEDRNIVKESIIIYEIKAVINPTHNISFKKKVYR